MHSETNPHNKTQCAFKGCLKELTQDLFGTIPPDGWQIVSVEKFNMGRVDGVLCPTHKVDNPKVLTNDKKYTFVPDEE